jgi:DNA-binding transcriptional ArsR family regulator
MQVRALAHPLRLRILSLLTGAEMTAAEIARELELTHANASYHLGQLHATGHIEVAGQERIHGGVAKRHRYILDKEQRQPGGLPKEDPDGRRLFFEAMVAELNRRTALLRRSRNNRFTDAEPWVDPEVWKVIWAKISEASNELHRAAKPPRTKKSIRVSATIALFEMEPSR